MWITRAIPFGTSPALPTSTKTLWSELFFADQSALIEEIGQFERSLNDVKRALETGDEAALKALMRQSAARRRLFGKMNKHCFERRYGPPRGKRRAVFGMLPRRKGAG